MNYFTLLLILSVITVISPTPTLSALVKQQPLVLKYHNGTLLKGKVAVNLIWYGHFTPAQRSIIVDFISSLSSPAPPKPSASSWWQTTTKYKSGATTILVGKQYLHEDYSLGKSLKNIHLSALASKIPQNGLNSVNVVLTAKDVGVEGFCSRCGSHGSIRRKTRAAYAWVGNSETQCAGQCAWPFHQPIYGPQSPPLISPNNDVGVDGMIINLATVLAGTVTNPFNNGFFQGPATARSRQFQLVRGCLGRGRIRVTRVTCWLIMLRVRVIMRTE